MRKIQKMQNIQYCLASLMCLSVLHRIWIALYKQQLKGAGNQTVLIDSPPPTLSAGANIRTSTQNLSFRGNSVQK